ncbi:4-oxalocrotonate tautomerase [Pasteurella testudinis DSM 23072]|uniref:4-oxalocrotonate tautomerase n=1 Tax=Pasteurella testudinis DSM 23072 TaxID=1122938 RepID=A0A1W1V767_9PAST|nr:tautomerase PptA [Pasteurella testudinis]SMB89123.1 4-oxalocrotonate tautomerase [Pasteurella testudinis DSM 23072]SUB50195.1 Tautomerase pptA [Pasteurella testudinis]
MPHINIQCYPKHLTAAELDAFKTELTALAVKHLKATDDVVSIDYNEVPAEQWQQVWDKDIAPKRGKLLKEPDYEMYSQLKLQ